MPNKLGGVVALAIAVIILFTLPFFRKTRIRGSRFNPVSKLALRGLLGVVVLLTWIGARPVEEPYVLVGQILTISYFTFYFSYLPLSYMWEKLLSYH